jgi:large subunit ribosomal protein L28
VSRSCAICGRKPHVGNQITRSGSPKYKGGIGLHTGGISKRRFYPNIQKIKIVLDGKVQHVNVCARCIKGNKIQRPAVRPNQIKRSAEKAEARRQSELAAEAARVAALALAEKEAKEAEAAEAAEAAASAAADAAREADRESKGQFRSKEPAVEVKKEPTLEERLAADKKEKKEKKPKKQEAEATEEQPEKAEKSEKKEGKKK